MDGQIRIGQQGRFAVEREDGLFVWMEVLERQELQSGDVLRGCFDSPCGELLLNRTRGTKLLAFIRGVGPRMLADRFVREASADIS
ncbi:hypothetical protein [Thiohalorhabdus methylotrophus]|uniref:Uncharacterized protein n=1 Tax=Thiohalorhabdus methylotrophus TaxID=3242694 RepID=A0ABV4TT21_9GAMM